ncbi:PAS domain-containing sensor histidine kinase [Hyphomicrobiales bacterium 4NK60-0047b]
MNGKEFRSYKMSEQRINIKTEKTGQEENPNLQQAQTNTDQMSKKPLKNTARLTKVKVQKSAKKFIKARNIVSHIDRPLLFKAGLITVVMALLSAVVTFLILTGLTPIAPSNNVVITVLLINCALILALVTIVLWQIYLLWQDRKGQTAGAELHIRIVSLFCMIAMLPAIILAIFASFSLDQRLDYWFSKRIAAIIDTSGDVARSFLDEHGQVIRSDIVAMATDLDESWKSVKGNREKFDQLLTSQTALRSLQMSYVFDADGVVLAKAATEPNRFFAQPSNVVMATVENNKVSIIPPGSTNELAAVKKLEKIPGAYLYVYRQVNQNVIKHLNRTKEHIAAYKALQKNRAGIQVAFGLMYVLIALILLLAAVWLGIWLANRIISPIRDLISAAQKVSAGDLDAEVPVHKRDGDVGHLTKTFNNMTGQLRQQRDNLMEANFTIDERRRFIEAVLSSVSAGIMGADLNGKINLVNKSAGTLLVKNEEDLVGLPLSTAVPEIYEIWRDLKQEQRTDCERQITLMAGDVERSFAVRVTEESSEDQDYGYVITFDDITELVSAERNSAWSDIARRIAHEIKNPLTPIQLSAERIRRKYGDKIQDDRDVFDKCTDTIIRQVADIGRMVDEFSSFARLPTPTMEFQDIREVVKEAVFLFQVSESKIKINVDVPKEAVIAYFDRRLINQAVTNLVKNASEAIETAQENGIDVKGEIETCVRIKNQTVYIDVLDNGCGLPKNNRNRLTEPYMTTRTKGTGLGLAIVQRITEQHGGSLRLADAPVTAKRKHGAKISLVIPLKTPADQKKEKSNAA